MAAQNGQKIFGAGRFYGIPIATTPTPDPFLLTQDIAIDFKRDIKRLYGQNQLPADIASGMLSVVGKVTNGVVAARAFNDLMIGGTLSSTGQEPWISNETGTIANSTLGPGTFTVANGASFALDLGVYAVASGIPYVRTASTAPSTGTYSASSVGVYAFSSLEGNVSFKASYLYNATGGQIVTMTNQPMGKIGTFQAVAAFLWGTDKGTIQLNSCMAANYGLATKLDDYTKPSFDFEAATDTTDTLGTFSFAEQS